MSILSHTDWPTLTNTDHTLCHVRHGLRILLYGKEKLSVHRICSWRLINVVQKNLNLVCLGRWDVRHCTYKYRGHIPSMYLGGKYGTWLPICMCVTFWNYLWIWSFLFPFKVNCHVVLESLLALFLCMKLNHSFSQLLSFNPRVS